MREPVSTAEKKNGTASERILPHSLFFFSISYNSDVIKGSYIDRYVIFG